MDRSAGGGHEADGAAVEAHLERALLHVPEDGRLAVAAGGRERQAPAGEDPRRAEVHGRAAARNLSDRIMIPGRVFATES